MKRKLVRSPSFVRSVKKFVKKNPQAARDIETALELLSEDAFDSRLHTHRLRGRLEGSWACSAGYDLRIIFKFVRDGEAEAILLETVGAHDEVY